MLLINIFIHRIDCHQIVISQPQGEPNDRPFNLEELKSPEKLGEKRRGQLTAMLDTDRMDGVTRQEIMDFVATLTSNGSKLDAAQSQELINKLGTEFTPDFTPVALPGAAQQR